MLASLQADSKMEAEAQGAHLGLAVLTPYFAVKDWPMRELRLMLSDNARIREGRFIPLFYKVCSCCQRPVLALSDTGSLQSKNRVVCIGQHTRLRGYRQGAALPRGRATAAAWCRVLCTL